MKCDKGTGIFAQAVKINIQWWGEENNHMVNRDVSSTLRLKSTLGTDIAQSFDHMFKSKKAVKKMNLLSIDNITTVWIIQVMLFMNLLHWYSTFWYVCF